MPRDSVYRRCLAAADALAASGALLIAVAVAGNDEAHLVMLCTVPLIVVLSKIIGTYDREQLLVHKSTLDEVPALFQVATLYALLIWGIDGLAFAASNDRRALVATWTTLLLLLLILRAGARSVARMLTAPERYLVVGDTPACDRFAQRLARSRSLHAVVAASVTPEAATSAGITASTNLDDLRVFVRKFRVERLMLTPAAADTQSGAGLIHAAAALGLKVSVMPGVLEVLGPSAVFDDIEGLPVLSTGAPGLSRSSRVLKRTLDVVGSAIALIALAPILMVIAIAIKVDSRGPVVFRQRRVGRDGRAFVMFKFRTMAPDADSQRDRLRHLNEADGLFKIARDPRITRVGRWLRKTSLDELPQLLNVIRGQMSLVGPRPLLDEEDSQVKGWHRDRLHLTPGMTGYWQILGSARIPMEDMVRIDYLYVTNWSMWLDVKILLRTIPYVLAGRGM
jgi:exopolysaccharide biosynthesis polyprenyl glycosylphosphotransferase